MMAPAVEIQALRYAYPDGTVAIRQVDLVVQAGETVGLIGANGAGKSTLLLHLNGILQGQGEVRIFGTKVYSTTLSDVRGKVGLVFQNPDDQLFCPTVYDDVAFGPRNQGLSEDEVERRVEAALEAVGLTGVARKSAFHLSIGQKKRAALATILSMDAQLLVLDEPTSNLDPRGRRELIELLRCLGGTQIIATHDLDLVRTLCTRVVLIEDGHCVADGVPIPFLDDAAFLEIHGL